MTKEESPTEDAVEALWLTYYANIFNPARVVPERRAAGRGSSPAASGWRPKGARTRGIFTSKADIARYIEAHNKGAPNPSNGPTGRRIR
jgi:hypothetical protein